MATGGQDQEETKKSLGYYLHWVLAREAGGHKPGGKAARKDRAGRKRAEEQLIARALTRVVFHHIITSDDTAEQFLSGLEEGQEEDFLTETAHNEYDVRIWLKPPAPRRALQVLTGKRHNLEPGQAKLCVCKSMTKEERMQVRSTYSMFMDDDCLAPRKVHEWLTQIVDFGFKALHGKVFRNRKLKLSLISHSFPTLRVILSCTTVSDEKEEHDVFSIIYNIIPSVHAFGFPQGACLQHPFPRQMPYSLEGHDLLEKIKEEIEDGDVSFMLEMPPGERGMGEGVGSRPVTQPALTKRAAQAAEAREERERKLAGQTWKLTLGQMDDVLLSRALQTPSMRHAKTAGEAFTAIKQSKGHVWQVINSSVQASAMLWTMKKSAQKCKNASDWFVAYVTTLHKFLSTRFCPQFLQMNVNALTSAGVEDVDNAASDLQTLLEDIDENPTNLLKHYLQKQ